MFEHIGAKLQRKNSTQILADSFPQQKLVRFSDEQMVKMHAICKERRITMSFFLRAILDVALEEIGNTND